MFEDYLRSDGEEERRRADANRHFVLLAGMVGTFIIVLAFFALTEFRARPHGFAAVRPWGDRRALWHFFWLVGVEGLLGVAKQRVRAHKQAGAAAMIVATVGVALMYATDSLKPAIAGGVAGLLVLLSTQVADQWEKCVVLRFGRYHGLRGPGLFFIIPIVDHVRAVIDARVRTTDVHSEVALTRDTLRVNVDAVIFWEVWDAEKAALEVQDFDRAVALVAQTSLFESIGRHELAEVLAGRESLGRDLQQVLQEKTTPWGITVQSVEIRDIRLPRELEDVMSRQAQADRERQARIILGTSEVELAAQFAQASEAYKNDPTALHLRAMNMLYEAIKEKGTMVVVPLSALRRRARRTIR